VNTLPDLLRLLVVPFFAWAAYTDVKTRRIPNRVWGPLFVAGVILLAVTLRATYATSGTFQLERDLAGVAISLGVVGPLAYLFWLFGGFGGADAKALLVLAVLFPLYPSYALVGFDLPLHQSTLGSFAFTILTNTVIVAALFPVGLFAKNALEGEFALPMFLGKRVRTDSLTDRYGTIMGLNDGMTAGKLDLDALRMYLSWRDATFADLRSDPETFRDPKSLPAERNDPGGGTIDEQPDGGDGNEPDISDRDGPDGSDVTISEPTGSTKEETDAGETQRKAANAESDVDSGADATEASDDELEDPWGAAQFLEEIEGDAYGTSPEALRDGLDVAVSEDAVWVSPGIPFIVPMFLGLVLAITAGNVLFAVLTAF
jgi:preflagellin peptidase FlaK